ncbi:minor capsid protein [Weissella bombi]|uniref:Bacteriophage minor capsid protein n=2 Tax=Weissella bombi TaxID=1505725 RepID=A0A1C4C7S6_9LACO|nr:minor capsid protein [Weissella bombi]SCC15157.1 bacteriophage minor capsid protein [Weissella bombi]
MTDKPSIALFPIPGGRTTVQYFNGTKEMDFAWQLMVQEESPQDTAAIMWAIYGALTDENLVLDSTDDSFEFNYMTPNQPELEGEKNNMTVWSLSGTANLTI